MTIKILDQIVMRFAHIFVPVPLTNMCIYFCQTGRTKNSALFVGNNIHTPNFADKYFLESNINVASHRETKKKKKKERKEMKNSSISVQL